MYRISYEDIQRYGVPTEMEDLKMSKEIPYKIYLEENEMPKQWYNVQQF